MEGFRVVIDPKKMFVNIIADNNIVNEISTKGELLDYLEKKTIIYGVDYNEIEKAFRELHTLTRSEKFTIAWGRTPINGRSAEVEFLTDVSGEVHYDSAVKNAMDSIDYKEAIKISRVKKGEVVGVITPPKEGKDGYNIEGKVLCSKDGKDINIALGHGAIFSPDKTKIIATQNGKPLILNNKISVEPVYEVHGDVCFETGNIDFDGHVYISGTVQDDFTVKANSIEIRGTVGASTIIAQNELIINGGVNGHYTGNIVCNGDAYIKYLNDANAEIHGNLVVKKGIINSVVKSLGKISAKKIIGGNVIALQGVVAKTIGSEMGVATFLEVGVNYEIKALDHALSNLSRHIENITNRYNDKLGDRIYFKKVTPKVQNRITSDYRSFLEIKKGYLRVLAKKSSLIHDDRLVPDSEIIVLERLYTDVNVSTTICHKEFIYEFSGPIKLVENLTNKSIRVRSFDTERDGLENDNNKEFKNMETIKYTDKVCTLRYDYFDGVRYTKEGVLEVERKFNYMVYGQKFAICIAENKHTQRLIIVRDVNNAGYDKVIDVKDYSDLAEIIKYYSNKKIVLVCGENFSGKNSVKLILEFLHTSKDSFGILLLKQENSRLTEAVSKIKHLEIIYGDFDIKTFKRALDKFELH